MADSKKFRVLGNVPVDLADGRVVAPLEVVSGLSTSDPHNKRLIDEGILSPVKAKQTTTKEDGK